MRRWIQAQDPGPDDCGIGAFPLVLCSLACALDSAQDDVKRAQVQLQILILVRNYVNNLSSALLKSTGILPTSPKAEGSG
ncbi:hypothetical protein Y1Q_0021886 [Alligator mississippiensis]|uniref:Uncharacterized protein n=1 Tax=Alligator mississippiensis TaxID=8496 RepID=A0A151M633_ALLMI|nr:hypothetical protein Y1Q_0021886 [Alligator mississippiensis]